DTTPARASNLPARVGTRPIRRRRARPSGRTVSASQLLPIVARVDKTRIQRGGLAMNVKKIWLAMVVLAAATTAAASAVNVVDKDNVKLNVGGYLQAIGVA